MPMAASKTSDHVRSVLTLNGRFETGVVVATADIAATSFTQDPTRQSQNDVSVSFPNQKGPKNASDSCNLPQLWSSIRDGVRRRIENE